MNERDVRLLFTANHWSGAAVRYAADLNGWLVEFIVASDGTKEVLTLKRGSPRVFRTSDTALAWCRELGFTKITVHLHKLHTETSVSANPARVLLVEDSNSDIELTLRAIQRLDIHFDMVVCRDGQEALDFLFGQGVYSNRDLSELPQLILLDLKLPKVNGLEVLNMIRNNPLTRCIPVVILTTSDEITDIERGYKMGTNSYVRKPVDYDVFCDTIKGLGEYWLNTNIPPPTN